MITVSKVRTLLVALIGAKNIQKIVTCYMTQVAATWYMILSFNHPYNVYLKIFLSNFTKIYFLN